MSLQIWITVLAISICIVSSAAMAADWPTREDMSKLGRMWGERLQREIQYGNPQALKKLCTDIEDVTDRGKIGKIDYQVLAHTCLFIGLDDLASAKKALTAAGFPVPTLQKEAAAKPTRVRPSGKTIAKPLPFRIVERRQLKKGGSIEPLRRPKYVLIVIKAVLTDQSKLTKQNVGATLRQLLQAVRSDARADGISALLYQSSDHLKGGNAALGQIEWWPKGHSFDPDNAANIENKATHVESITVFSLPQPASSVVGRLSESVRREIFTAMVHAQDRATKEAETKYPTDSGKIPISKLRTYDWGKAIKKNSEENKRLDKKYERELIQKYKISESELEAIGTEGSTRHWPLPSFR